MQKYFYLPEMLCFIDEPNSSVCRKILEENETLFKTVQGSTHNHQNWPGGYWDHITEVMNIAIVTYKTFNPLRTLSFSLSDALLVSFLHDIEKPWKYEIGPDTRIFGRQRIRKDFDTPAKEHEFRNGKLTEYGIVLTPEQANAMSYVHGELNDYSPEKRVAGPLAAFCHICDFFSSRIWFAYPKEGFQDSWWPAQRVNSNR